MLIMTYYIFEDQGDESEFKESDYRKEVWSRLQPYFVDASKL